MPKKIYGTRRQCMKCGHHQTTYNECWWTCEECGKRNRIPKTPPLKPYIKPRIEATPMDDYLKPREAA